MISMFSCISHISLEFKTLKQAGAGSARSRDDIWSPLNGKTPGESQNIWCQGNLFLEKTELILNGIDISICSIPKVGRKYYSFLAVQRRCPTTSKRATSRLYQLYVSFFPFETHNYQKTDVCFDYAAGLYQYMAGIFISFGVSPCVTSCTYLVRARFSLRFLIEAIHCI